MKDIKGEATVAKGTDGESKVLMEKMKTLGIPGDHSDTTNASASEISLGQNSASKNIGTPPNRGPATLGTSETSKGKIFDRGCDEKDVSYSDDYDDDTDDENGLAALDVRPGLHNWLE